jgi:hypothetical protein
MRKLILITTAIAGVLGLVIAVAPKMQNSTGEVSVRDKDRLKSSTVENLIPLARKPYSADGRAWVFACQSIELYRRLAPMEMAPAGEDRNLVGKAFSAGECADIDDTGRYAGLVQPHHKYRVASIQAGFACVWSVDYDPGGCLWTAAANLHHIGRGPQLSENQFRDVRVLYARLQDLRDQHSDYALQALRIKDRQGDRREEAHLRALSDQAREEALTIEGRIAQFQPTVAPPIESDVTKPERESYPGEAWDLDNQKLLPFVDERR